MWYHMSRYVIWARYRAIEACQQFKCFCTPLIAEMYRFVMKKTDVILMT